MTIGFVTGILVYVVLWWLIFFMTLSWGHQALADPEPGLEHGAPENPRLWLKAGVTTAITSFIFLLLYLYVPADLMQWSYFKNS